MPARIGSIDEICQDISEEKQVSTVENTCRNYPVKDENSKVVLYSKQEIVLQKYNLQKIEDLSNNVKKFKGVPNYCNLD